MGRDEISTMSFEQLQKTLQEYRKIYGDFISELERDEDIIRLINKEKNMEKEILSKTQEKGQQQDEAQIGKLEKELQNLKQDYIQQQETRLKLEIKLVKDSIAKLPPAYKSDKKTSVVSYPERIQHNSNAPGVDITKITKNQLSKMPDGTAFVVPINFDKGKHEYSIDVNAAPNIAKQFGEKGFMSPSEIGSLLRGWDIESVKALQDAMEKLDPVKDAEKIAEYRDKLSKIPSWARNQARMGVNFGSEATIYGTAFHRIIQLIETGKIGNGGTATNEEIVKYIKSQEGRQDEDLKDAKLLSKLNDDGTGNANTVRLLENVSQYFKFKEAAGLQSGVSSEQMIGAMIKVGDQVVKLAGTIDQFWLNSQTLVDLKTSKKISPEYAYQIQAYAALIKALTGQEVKNAKIFKTPRDSEYLNEMEDISIASEEDRNKMLAAAYTIKTSQGGARIAAIDSAKKEIPYNMGREVTVEHKERIKKNGEKWIDTLLNGKSIYDSDWDPEELAENIGKIKNGEEYTVCYSFTVSKIQNNY